MLHREDSRVVDYIICDVQHAGVSEGDNHLRKLLVTNSRYFDALTIGSQFVMKCVVDLMVGTKHQYSLHLSEIIESSEEANMVSGKKATTRNRERTLLEIVRRISAETGTTVNLADVLTEAGRLDINRDTAEDIIEALCRDGRLMRPGGYDTLQPV